MDENEFWDIVDDVHKKSHSDMDMKCTILAEKLSELSEQNITQFNHFFDAAIDRAYSWPLWGAAYLVNGGCSDDSFIDFRATLISHGRTTFESVLNNPDNLSDVEIESVDDLFYEGYQYVGPHITEKKSGKYPDRLKPPPTEPFGKEWQEDELEKLYPRLAKKITSHQGDQPSLGQSPSPWWKFWRR